MASNPKGWAIALQRIAHEAKARTGALDLGMLGLTELPEELFALTHLRELNLGAASAEERQARRESGAPLSRNELKSALERADRVRATANNVRFRDGHRRLGLGEATERFAVARLLRHASERPRAAEGPDGPAIARLLRTQVSDLAPLKGLPALQSLVCWGTQVSDIGPLKGLTALQSLDCSLTLVSDLAPLKGLIALQSLDCSRTQVSDLAPLKGRPPSNHSSAGHASERHRAAE